MSNKKIRLHQNLCLAVYQALIRIFLKGKYADKTVQDVLQSNKKWGARDRRFVAESIYEIVRWKRLLLYSIRKENTNNPKDVRDILIVWLFQNAHELPDWDWLRDFDTESIRKVEPSLLPRKIRESIPDWLDQLGESQIPNWDAEIQTLNQVASIFIRVNTTKTSVRELKKLLLQTNIETEYVPEIPTALKLKKRRNITTSIYFKSGCFEIQDASSQLVANFLDVKPKQIIVDACAGAGGKTLHIANLTDNQSKLIAMDTNAHKLLELQKRAQRANAVIETQRIQNITTMIPYKNTADRLLLDVPCSGLGVLRRNPDAKWKLNPKFIAQVSEKQRFILENYAHILKVGGKLVYATCSILPAENQEQIKNFLKKHAHQFELISEQTISPVESGFDGFYMACLYRKS